METDSPDHFYRILNIYIEISNFGLGVSISFLILLLICSALISGSEVAFFSLNSGDFKKLEKDNSLAAQRIMYLKEIPRKLLAAILIANNLINIAIVILSDFIIQNILPKERYEAWARGLERITVQVGWDVETVVRILEFSLTVIAVTFLLVLFGEVAPKLYANLNRVTLSKTMAGPLRFLTTIFSPFTSILVSLSSRLERSLTKRVSHFNTSNREDIDKAIDLTIFQNNQSDSEIDILKRIVKFGDVTAKQIMRSRSDIIAIEENTSFDDLLGVIRESGYSRLPVYKEDFDHLVGILYVKDLIGFLGMDEGFNWQRLVRNEILYVPESKKISELLKEFQSNRVHLGIVVDEFGGTEGLITLEDVMEEVIGDIQDEFDDEIEVEYRMIDNFTYVFEGKTLINDFSRIVGIDSSIFDEIRGDADSIAGLVLQLLGQIPRKNSEIKYKDFRFKIIAVGKRRIEEVQITLPKE